MRVCPCCGYRDPPYWRPAKMHNPSGDMDIARIDDLQLYEQEVAKLLTETRGTPVVFGIFAYLLSKRGVWVRRMAADVYRDCGIAAFNPPTENSGHTITHRVDRKERKK